MRTSISMVIGSCSERDSRPCTRDSAPRRSSNFARNTSSESLDAQRLIRDRAHDGEQVARAVLKLRDDDAQVILGTGALERIPGAIRDFLHEGRFIVGPVAGRRRSARRWRRPAGRRG